MSEQTRNVPEPFIGAAEVAAALGKHPETVRRWAREGKIPFRRIGQEFLFRWSEVERAMETGAAA